MSFLKESMIRHEPTTVLLILTYLLSYPDDRPNIELCSVVSTLLSPESPIPNVILTIYLIPGLDFLPII